LGTDLICGLPGETEDIFEKSLDFISALPLANIHMFKYSPRQGTDAAKFADRPQQGDVRRRMKILEKAEKKLARSFISSQIGREASFIAEKIEKDACIGGWSDNYIRTSVRSQNRTDELIRIRFLRMRDDSSFEAEAI
jgi:threonylcarbamoyladenosine tRNA methylthiotransferase MtaB